MRRSRRRRACSASATCSRRCRAAVARRTRATHGHVLVIGGGPGMPGAARLAGEAALRAGAGLVTVAVHPDNVGIVADAPRADVRGRARGRATSPRSLARATVVAIGPGLGPGRLGAAACSTRRSRAGMPLVVDADALNLLAERAARAAIAGCSRRIPARPRGCSARRSGRGAGRPPRGRARLQARYGGTVVLKGAGSIVQSPRATCRGICDRGNPGMAAGGMGDVLTGVIAGIAAQCGDLARRRAGRRVRARAGRRPRRAPRRARPAGQRRARAAARVRQSVPER